MKSTSNEVNPSEKETLARQRWRLLSEAIFRHPSSNINKFVNTSFNRYRFHWFDLILVTPLDNNISENWNDYSTNVDDKLYSVKIRHLTVSQNLEELAGFNKTGNICVWPSEEVLAYYCLGNKNLFDRKSVLELGGGMTCLAGLLIGKYSKSSKVLLTDGNEISVNNVKNIIEKNEFKYSNVSCSVLKWGCCSFGNNSKFDFIITADCLFFEECRNDLVNTIWNLLNDNGMAIIMAPKRGNSLLKFIERAKHVGFNYNIYHYYNECVWKRHIKLLSQLKDYNEDSHYPILTILFKSNCLVPFSTIGVS